MNPLTIESLDHTDGPAELVSPGRFDAGSM